MKKEENSENIRSRFIRKSNGKRADEKDYNSGLETRLNIQREKELIPKLIQYKPGSKTKVIALGGLCEIGKNTWVFDHEGKILLIDAGLGFPSDNILGSSILLPELTYLVENQSRIIGMVLTHGHEDHIGGIPNLLKKVPAISVIYGPPLAIGLLENKLRERRINNLVNLKRIKARETIKFGESFAVTFVRNNHSIPDSFSLVIQTPAGQIVHSGDFKFDHTPVDGQLFDIATLAEAGKKGTDLLISDSTNSERAGHTPSERAVFAKIEEAFVKAKKRIIVTTFASQVHRIKQILELAIKYNRKVVILGRSMQNISLISRKLGYMSFPENLIIRIEELSKYDLDQILILSTGSQGEPLSALTRVSKGTHQKISIVPGDTVVMSATPIPGNERSVADVVNNLFAKGAKVIYGRDSAIHVSGHGSQEEHKLLIGLVKPKNFMPFHGEYRMLVQHGKISEKICVPKQNVFIMENGDILELSKEKAEIKGRVPARAIAVDNANQDHITEQVIEQRRTISQNGIVYVCLTILRSDLKTKEKQIIGPEFFFSGISFKDSLKQEISSISKRKADFLKNLVNSEESKELRQFEDSLSEELSKELLSKHKLRPLIKTKVLVVS